MSARLAGQQLEELEEIQQTAEAESFIEGIVTKIKKLMFSALGKLGFFGIMLFASVISLRCHFY